MTIEESSTDDIQSIEPTSSLINAFGNEVGWVDSFELFFSHWVRVIDLSIRHRPTFKPTIKYFLYSSQLAFALFRRNSYMVNILTMDIINVSDPW